MFPKGFFNLRYWLTKYWAKEGLDSTWPTTALPENTVDILARTRTVIIPLRERTVDIEARTRSVYV